MSNIYDNWERLVDVVLDREQLRELALISSNEPSSCSVSSSISGWSTPIHDGQIIQLGSSSSTKNETDWERLLPSDYEDIISRSVNPVAYATKEDLYTSLCSSPILLDGGKMSFHIDKTTGKNCYMIGAMELESFHIDKTTGNNCYMIGGSEFNNGSLKRTMINDHRKSTPDSRFSMVAELRDIGGLDVRGKIETQMLSPKTRYAAFLVYRFGMFYKNLRPAKGTIKFVYLDEDRDAEKRATTIKFRPVSRPDGWMEVQLGMFYNDLGSDGPVEARLLDFFAQPFHNFVIEGIEFRPATNAKENVKNRRKWINFLAPAHKCLR